MPENPQRANEEIGVETSTPAPDPPAPSPSSVGDQEAPIVALIVRNEFRAAIGALAERYFDHVYDFCVHRLRDRVVAEDVTQRVFLEAFRDLARYRGHATLRSWLFGIADHRCRDERKARDRRARRLDPEPIEVVDAINPAPDPADDTEHRRRHRALDDCLQQLHESTREAVVMHYTRELTYEEMSDILGTKAGTLQRRVARALLRLRRCLDQKGLAP